jgi:hypothetical protein
MDALKKWWWAGWEGLGGVLGTLLVVAWKGLSLGQGLPSTGMIQPNRYLQCHYDDIPYGRRRATYIWCHPRESRTIANARTRNLYVNARDEVNGSQLDHTVHDVMGRIDRKAG